MKLLGPAYRVLLLAYPPEFRDRFGRAMEQALGDRYRAAAARGAGATTALAIRTVLDVAANAFVLRVTRRERVPMNWQSLVMDARYAVRMFARNPVFTLLAVAALTLGIGANTAIFTIVNGVLLRPLPYGDPGRLVMVWSTNAIEHRDHDVVAPLDFIDFKKAGAFSELHAAYSFLIGAALTSPSGAEQILVSGVTPGMFEMLGRAPALGRTFTPSDVTTAVVVSHGFWRARLGGDPSVLGRTLNIANHPRTIVGVMPPDFVFPYKAMLGPSGFSRSTEVEAWLPLEFVAADSRQTGVVSLTRSARYLSVVGRLKPGVTAAQANAEIAGIAQQLAAAYPASNRAVGGTVVPLHEQAVGGTRPALLLLLGGVGFVLLMACVNLANLLLARSSVRQREMAIRSALGAARRRLIMQTMVETMLLSAAGGILALVMVTWAIGALVALAPPDLPRLAEIRPDAAVLAFTFALSLVTGLAIGIVPALSGSRPAVQSSLKESGRGATSGRGQRRLRSALVVAEVALAVVLTLGAGLLFRSFLSVLSINPGFNPDRLLTLQIALPNSYQTPDQRRALYASLFSRLDALPGVASVGGTTRLPLGSTNVTTRVAIEGRDLPPGEWPEVEFRRAVHNYFAAMGIPILRGRGFTGQDGPNSPPVIVINQTMARRLFGNADPVGQRLRTSTATGPTAPPPSTIIGVIGDVRHSGLEAEPAPEMYTWYIQNPPTNPFIVVRATGDASSLATAVRAQVQSVDKNIAAYDIRPMAQVRAESVAQRRFVLMLVAAFGVLALVMAAVGVYGVMALIVSERTAEIGVRLALGAQPMQVLRAVVLQGVTLAAGGVVAGVLLAAVLAPLVATQLYGVRPLDPPTLIAVPALLLAIATLACLVPARRAMTIDPVSALRA
ncbi:MAG TPA: ABC transporter permease [Vicinamibacterales bacterium]|nr:ABC transporter permease [Vicinamibacterales bacterium]